MVIARLWTVDDVVVWACKYCYNFEDVTVATVRLLFVSFVCGCFMAFCHGEDVAVIIVILLSLQRRDCIHGEVVVMFNSELL